MLRSNSLINVLALSFILALLVSVPHSGKPASDQKKVDNFTLKDVNGESHSLADFKNSKAIVLMFISTECPISNGYNKRMKNIYSSFNDKNITFIGINSNQQEHVPDIKQHSKDNGFEFLILKDENNVVADKLGATVTPEIYVLNSNLEMLYHGRIDDSRREEDVKSEDLKNVLNSVIRDEKVTFAETKAFGCTIKRVN